MRFFETIFFFLLLLVLVAQPSENKSGVQKINRDLVKVLLIGNSLTYSNDLPGLLKAEAAKIEVKLQTKMVANPNYALIDHWNDGKVQKIIKNGDFDYVILQQGPSSQEFGRHVLFEYGQKFEKLCSKKGCKLVYFIVWPSKRYYNTFDGVIKNHREAAKANNAILCPVGEVWKQHFDETNDFSFYGKDGFHPSLAGSKIAAKVIVETLFQNL